MKRFILLTLLIAAMILPAQLSAGNTKVDTDSVTAANPVRKKRGLFIGDSITDGGWGRSGGSSAPASERDKGDFNHIYGHSYVMLAVAQLTAEHPDLDYEWVNRGISGNTLADLEKRWDEDALDEAPDLLTILIGTNDILVNIRNNSIDTFDTAYWHQCYRALIDRTRAVRPDVKIVLITPFVYPNRYVSTDLLPTQRKYVDLLAEEVRRLADESGAVVIDANRLFEPLCRRDGSTHWVWDGIHPSPAGHYVMAKWWLEATKDIID